MLIIACSLVIYLFRSNEPTYAGRTLSQWIIRFEESSNRARAGMDSVSDVETSEHAIKTIGTNGIPTLLKFLQARDYPALEQLEGFVQRRLGWNSFYICDAEEKHWIARRGFFVLGKDARSATPELLHLLETCPPTSAEAILMCLSRIDPPKDMVIPKFNQLLNSPSGRFKRLVAMCFEVLYPEEAREAGVDFKYIGWPQTSGQSQSVSTNITAGVK